METGNLTKVLNDFLTTVEGELSLCKGDYFLVHTVIDKHWCYGESNGRTGKFPSSHLHKIDIPKLSEGQKLFVAIAAFSGEQDGDLSFGQGELIIGVQDVGSGWYFGRIDCTEGIFPTTHTWQINTDLLKKCGEKKMIKRRARVKTNLKAQLDGELDLVEGETLTVIEVFEDGWCFGKKDDGAEGTFPENFISYLQDEEETAGFSAGRGAAPSLTSMDSTDLYEEPAPSYYDIYPEFLSESVSARQSTGQSDGENVPSIDDKPYAISLYAFTAQYPNELSFLPGEVIYLIKRVNSEWMEGEKQNTKGIFPTSYVKIVRDCPDEKKDEVKSETLSSEEEKGAGLVVGSKLTVEFNFEARMPEDLSVTEREVVTVLEVANKDWVKVKNQNEETGLCPMEYLKPIQEPPSEPADEFSQDLFEDFVVIRAKKPEEPAKRLSQPHRPAPPVPGPPGQPQDRGTKDEKQKKADQRQNVISELVLTEKEYVRDLNLTYTTFNLHNPGFLEGKGVDVTVLFGNLLEVIQVAEELLDLILRAMKGCDEEYQTVGPCFLKMAEKLQTVYVKYCGNHEAALALLKKYESNEEIMTVFNKGIETLRYQIACFDMSSILIKPVQRILKYHLILYELIKCTEDDHPDKPSIEEAWKRMTEVASHINEYKRRKDFVSKYLANDNTLIRKMAKLNMHSVAKMSTRLSTKLSATLGLTNLSVDPEFEELERQFHSVEKCTLQLAKDAEQSLSNLNTEVVSAELISNYLIQYFQGTENIEANRLRMIRAMISTQFLQELKACLEKRVLAPLNLLATLLEGPAVLVTKRHDKLLDYDAAISKSEKYKESRIAQEELATAKTNFEALTQQLLEELPVVIDAATKVLVNCISAFAHSRKLLSGKITKRYLTLCESTTQVSIQDILESFLVTHSLLWNQITRFNFSAGNCSVEDKQVKFVPQSDRQKVQLKTKYPPEKLYIVTEDVQSASSLDLGAGRGTIVAVVKNQDPMGDASRWFVDNGLFLGFLPAHSLQPVQKSATALNQNPVSSTKRPSVPDLMCLDSPEREVKTESHLKELLELNLDEPLKTSSESPIIRSPYQNLSSEFYHAEYDFAGDMPGTLPMFRGQALKLLRPHDEKGNGAWWLMEDREGKTGYVPRNYLNPVYIPKQ